MSTELLKRLAYIVTIVGVLVGAGVTYGLAKAQIDQLKSDISELKSIVKDVQEVKTDVQWIKLELQLRKKGS